MQLKQLLAGALIWTAGVTVGTVAAVRFIPPREVQVVEHREHEVRVAEVITIRVDGVPCTFGKVDGKVFWLCDENKPHASLSPVDG